MTYGYSYHRIVRKVVVAFGNLFNGINLSRYDEAGTEKEKFLVPIVYGGKEKYVSRLEGDPNLDKKVQITLPMMSFELVNMKYDAATIGNHDIEILTVARDQDQLDQLLGQLAAVTGVRRLVDSRRMNDGLMVPLSVSDTTAPDSDSPAPIACQSSGSTAPPPFGRLTLRVASI